MSGGIAASLVSAENRRESEAIGLFEVDEFWVPEVCSQKKPSLLLFGNLFRDQLDRYGELDSILDRWRDCLPSLVKSGTRLLLCADDPAIASLADGLNPSSIVWFGIDDTSCGIGSLPHSADAGNCRACGAELTYDVVLLGHLGHWRCPNCDLRRPALDYSLSELKLTGATRSQLALSDRAGDMHSVELALPGVYNAYNALSAWVVAAEAGIASAAIKQGIEGSDAAFGRAEEFVIDGTDAAMLLIKNPTGANEVLRTLELEGDHLNLVVILNDRIADGRDVSWIWDADFDVLADRTTSVICSGTRSAELALRLSYAGYSSAVTVREPLTAVREAAANGNGKVWILPTYSAMLALRGQLEDAGLVAAVK